jgi:hypothetical protein
MFHAETVWYDWTRILLLLTDLAARAFDFQSERMRRIDLKDFQFLAKERRSSK